MSERQEFERYMRVALEEAQLAFDAGEVPVGAVLVQSGVVIARAHNRVEGDHDATRHAEIICLREGMAKLGGRLSDCTLFVTLEPCAMCAGACVNAKLGRLVFGAFDEAAGCCGSKNGFSRTNASSTAWKPGAEFWRTSASLCCRVSFKRSAKRALFSSFRIRDCIVYDDLK